MSPFVLLARWTDDEVIDIGGHLLQWIDTPHVPGPWEAGALFDQTTQTLFCGDLFSRTGPAPAATTDGIADAAHRARPVDARPRPYPGKRSDAAAWQLSIPSDSH